jgi:hypothetical protein
MSSNAYIPVKDAVNRARSYIRDFSDIFPSQNSLRLEETELDTEFDQWLITLSFDMNPLGEERRAYKLFKIDARTGEIFAMKNL